MFTVLIFILVLGVLVLVHEIGHFVAALKAGCQVDEFGIGFPPRIFSFKKRGILFSINLLPLGGFVKIKGENGDDSQDPSSFAGKSAVWRSLIVSAGVLMNIALAYVLITIGLLIGAPAQITEEIPAYAKVSNRQVIVTDTLPDSPAAQAGLLPNDIIISVNDTPIYTAQDLADTIKAEQNYSVEYKREQNVASTTIAAKYNQEAQKPIIGIGLIESGIVRYPWYLVPFIGIQKTVSILGSILAGLAFMIKQIFTSGSISADVAGPIGIAAITGQVAQMGIQYLLQFMAILSLNLAVINILPLPALDGSRLVLIILEKIRRKKLQVKVEQVLNIIGFGFLMMLMLFVTIKDLRVYGGAIIQYFTQLF